MISQFFTYDKNKVIQALRYHFITRKEIKIMIILVNVFAILSGVLFYIKKIQPMAFLAFSVMWFVLMIVFWFLLPRMVYKKAATFQDRLKVSLLEQEFKIENDRGAQSW
ncbi:MAG: YcxB family protein, partial [Chitinophagaceae bacterium]